MSPCNVNKKAKKKAFFEVAIKLFAERGYDYTTVDEIYKAAIIGNGTDYENTKSKEYFIREAYKIYCNSYLQMLKIIANPLLSSLIKLRKLAVLLAEEYLKAQEAAKVILNRWPKGKATKIQNEINLEQFYSKTRYVIDKLLHAAAKKRKNKNSHLPVYFRYLIPHDRKINITINC